MLERRRFLAGLAGIICAPAIVRAASIMPVRPFLDDGVALVSMAHPVGVDAVAADISPLSIGEFKSANLEFMIRVRARIEKEFFQDIYVSRGA